MKQVKEDQKIIHLQALVEAKVEKEQKLNSLFRLSRQVP